MANRERQAKLKRMHAIYLKKGFLAILWLLSTLSSHVWCIEASGTQNSNINDFWVFEDKGGLFSQQTIGRSQNHLWTHHKSPNLNLGYSQSTVWVKFNIENASNKTINRILDITYPLLDSVVLYKATEDGMLTQAMTSGDAFSFRGKSVKHPNHIQLIKLEARQSLTYYVKIKSNSPIQTQFIIWDINEFQSHYRKLSGVNFFYLGLIFSIVIFNFCVYLFLKESVYLSYSIYASFFALLIASQNALLFEYIYPNSPNVHNWSQLFFAAGTIIATVIFNYQFLRIEPHSPSQTILKLSGLAPLIILVISPLIGFSLAIKAIVICALIVVPICFIIGIIQSSKREDKKIYLLAWLWLIVGVIVFLLQKLGLLPFNLLTTNAIQIGSALELVTFAIALAQRIHTERETRIHAQQLIIENSKKTAELHKKVLNSATHHPTTTLPNRIALENWIDNSAEGLSELKVVLVKLSRINEIDKTLGHAFSEEALLCFSKILNNHAKQINGALKLSLTHDHYIATINSSTHCLLIQQDNEQISHTLSTLKTEINKPFQISIMEVDPYLTLSYSNYPEDGTDAASLIRQAWIAMDHTSIGEKSIVKYEKNIDPYSERRLSMMSELNRAIFSDKLELHYQPLIDTKTKALLGAEALVRWPHEKYGLIMPDDFIQPAEQTGVIQSLSLWVLRNAIKQQLKWIKVQPAFLLSVNISAFNLQDKKFIEAVRILFSEHELLAKNIILEITETQMMTDTHHALKNLWELSELGFHIAIDDFGTGYSNLAYLKKLPASELKIDKSFILDLESDKQNQVLVQTAIHMAHNLGLKVVAEGVESEHSRAILSDMGCDMCQGFHFSRPIPIDQFNTFMMNNAKSVE